MATATEFRRENPVSVVPDLSAVNKALEALRTSSDVTAATSYEADSENPLQKSWFAELTKDEQQTAFNLVKLDVKRVLKGTEFPYLRSKSWVKLNELIWKQIDLLQVSS
jgi:hypothetical protein